MIPPTHYTSNRSQNLLDPNKFLESYTESIDDSESLLCFLLHCARSQLEERGATTQLLGLNFHLDLMMRPAPAPLYSGNVNVLLRTSDIKSAEKPTVAPHADWNTAFMPCIRIFTWKRLMHSAYGISEFNSMEMALDACSNNNTQQHLALSSGFVTVDLSSIPSFLKYFNECKALYKLSDGKTELPDHLSAQYIDKQAHNMYVLFAQSAGENK